MKLSRLIAALVCIGAAYGQDASTPPAAPQDPEIIEDGGISIEPIYWFTQAQPALFGGKTATAFGDLSYLGKSKTSEGVEIGVPAGRANTLRMSYFRVQGSTNGTFGQAGTLFTEAYTVGDFLTSTYRLQNVKLSWDYLGYTWQRSHIRLKTLYEVQFVTISTDVSAPFKATTTDSSGTVDYNTAHGSKNLVYPTLGMEFEQAVTKNIRWEAKGSGFGLPHRAVIWDAQADLALRLRSVEFLIGGKAYHFKTSPSADQYFTDTLQGAFIGLRYYWGRPE